MTRLPIVLLLVGLSASVLAQDAVATFEQISVGSATKRLATTTWDPGAGRPQMTACDLRVESASVRYRIEGTPTATTGTPLLLGIDPLRISLYEAQRVEFIGYASASTTALVNVSCWK